MQNIVSHCNIRDCFSGIHVLLQVVIWKTPRNVISDNKALSIELNNFISELDKTKKKTK